MAQWIVSSFRTTFQLLFRRGNYPVVGRAFDARTELQSSGHRIGSHVDAVRRGGGSERATNQRHHKTFNNPAGWFPRTAGNHRLNNWKDSAHGRWRSVLWFGCESKGQRWAPRFGADHQPAGSGPRLT